MSKLKLKWDLCEGLIVNGRCVDCGMLYQHNSRNYYLNEQRPVNDENKEIYASKTYEASEKDKYQNRQRKAENNQWNRTVTTDNKRTSAGTAKKQPKSKVGAIVTVIFIVIALIAELFENMEFSSTGVAEAAPEPEYTVEEDFEYAEPDIYEFVVEEMPAQGEEYEVAYTSGNYIVGQQIPEGIYTATMSAQSSVAIPGSWVSVEDNVNSIYQSWWFDEVEEQDGYYVIEDIYMFEGAKIEIMTYGEVILHSSNAQISDMQTPVANSLTEPVVLGEEEVIVGEDMEPGTYDAVLVSGDLEVNIISPDGYQYWYHLCMEEDYACMGFNNIVLEEGDIIKIEVYGEEEGHVILNPSQEIFE